MWKVLEIHIQWTNASSMSTSSKSHQTLTSFVEQHSSESRKMCMKCEIAHKLIADILPNLFQVPLLSAAVSVNTAVSYCTCVTTLMSSEWNFSRKSKMWSVMRKRGTEEMTSNKIWQRNSTEWFYYSSQIQAGGNCRGVGQAFLQHDHSSDNLHTESGSLFTWNHLQWFRLI